MDTPIDPAAAPAGMEAIPADMPDAPHGDISLEYNLQNFNALVAANTAMAGEISAFDDERAAVSSRIDTLLTNLADLRAAAEGAQSVMRDQRNELERMRKASEGGDADLLFERDRATALQRRLDRTLGYVDRFLDDEEGIRSPEARTVPAPRPPVGPDLGAVPDPVRRGRDGAYDPSWMAASARMAPDFAASRPRRY